jgi:hypothetical protein
MVPVISPVSPVLEAGYLISPELATRLPIPLTSLLRAARTRRADRPELPSAG